VVKVRENVFLVRIGFLFVFFSHLLAYFLPKLACWEEEGLGGLEFLFLFVFVHDLPNEACEGCCNAAKCA
jgi:hypothetical protein